MLSCGASESVEWWFERRRGGGVVQVEEKLARSRDIFLRLYSHVVVVLLLCVCAL